MKATNECFKGRSNAGWSTIIGVFLLLCLISSVLIYQAQTPIPNNLHQPSTVAKSHILANFAKIPLAFEVNNGQVDNQVKYLSRNHGYNLFFTPTALVFSFQSAMPAEQKHGKSPLTNVPLKTNNEVIHVDFVGANVNPTISGAEKLQTTSNYFLGKDPKAWHTNISNFARVNYKNLYPGINATFYGNQDRLEYDINIAPNVDPKAFRLNFQGMKNITINKNGDLVLTALSGKSISMHKPIVYQEINGTKKTISGNFVIVNNQVGFNIGAYDKTKPLIIDPILYYSSYLGSASNLNIQAGIAIDDFGSAYIIGTTTDANFPVINPYQGTMNGSTAAVVTKFNVSGDSLIYSTFLGANQSDGSTTDGFGIAVDSAHNAYVTGDTNSANFPTVNPFQSTKTGTTDAFVTKIDATGGNLTYSTYLGSDDTTFGQAIAVDNSNSSYVTGYLSGSNFPLAHSFQDTNNGSFAAFVTKFDASGSGLVYSTYLGSNTSDGKVTKGHGIAIDSANNTYITGYTTSDNFPTINAYQNTRHSTDSKNDAFVTKFDANFVDDKLFAAYSTYLGGSDDNYGYSIAVDNDQSAYVTGYTTSTDFPTQSPYQGSANDNWNAFVTKFNTAGTGLVYSTYLGANISDSSQTFGYVVAVDSLHNAYVTGTTTSGNFPTTTDAFQPQLSTPGALDAFVTKFNSAGSALFYSTYLGNGATSIGTAIAVDRFGSFYITGDTSASNFPTTSNAYNNSKVGDVDTFNIFVARFSDIRPWSWTNNNITNGTQLDVFDLTTSPQGLFALARDQVDQSKARVYFSNDPITPTWAGCGWEIEGGVPTPHTSARFGINVYNSSVYVPTDNDSQIMLSNGSGFNAVRVDNTSGNNTAAFILNSANRAYFIARNASGGDDAVMMGNNSSGSWVWTNQTITNTGKIYYIDGDDAAQQLYIATANGLYACTGAKYVSCNAGNWSKITTPYDPNPITRVIYKFKPGDQTIPPAANTSLLAIGGHDGVYVSTDNGSNWSSKIEPIFGNIISGIAVDTKYIYITSYTVAAAHNNKSELGKYSVDNFKQSDCRKGRNELINGLSTGGLTIGKVYVRGLANPSVNIISDFEFGNTSNGSLGYSPAVMGVSLLSNSTTFDTEAVYVPTLGPSCNGGYSTGVLQTTFIITATAEEHGSISPSGDTPVAYGASQSFNISPDTGYHISDVLVDGVSVGTPSTYTFTAVTANHTITASFAIDTFTITSSAGPGGSIAGPSTVDYGDTPSFFISPFPGYHISDVLVDGSSVGTPSVYPFGPVTSDHTIEAFFEADPVITYTITSSAGPGGSIDPNGQQIVISGGSITFNINPDPNFHISDVLVDGFSVGTPSTYTFDGVTADHTIEAHFDSDTFTNGLRQMLRREINYHQVRIKK